MVAGAFLKKDVIDFCMVSGSGRLCSGKRSKRRYRCVSFGMR